MRRGVRSRAASLARLPPANNVGSRRQEGRAEAGGGAAGQRWRLRLSPRILAEDLDDIGDDAYETARETIKKKLGSAPNEYGDPLRHPLLGMRKLKVSHVRIVYKVFDDRHEVRVYMIAARRDIWAQDQKRILSRADELAALIVREEEQAAAVAATRGRDDRGRSAHGHQGSHRPPKPRK